MSQRTSGTLPGGGTFAAFLASDVVLLVVAWILYSQGHRPLEAYEVLGVAACTGAGAWLGVWPFVLRYRAELARESQAGLADAVEQIARIEEVAGRVELATSRWQTVQEHATQAVEAAREVGERMTAETRGFQTFLEKAQHVERQHLELEVSKLRRSEGEWLQTMVRILDHVHSLYVAAQRSGQPRLAEQITLFQGACRESARRTGLVAHAAAAGTAFDPAVHQLLNSSQSLPANPVVTDTVGPGYTFQGQMLRRIVVEVAGGEPGMETASVVSSEAATLSSAPAGFAEPGEAMADGPVADGTFLSVSPPIPGGAGGDNPA